MKMLGFAALIIVTFGLTCPSLARVPTSVRSDLCQKRQFEVVTRHERLPENVRLALRRAFQQRIFFMANPREKFQQTDVIVIKPGQKQLPTRRLLFAFRTSNHFVVYYESASAGLGANALVFLIDGNEAKMVWGGVEIDHDKLAKNPAELVNRICKERLISDRAFLW